MIDYVFVLIAMLLGNILSVLLPYLRKWYEGKVSLFDWRYAIDGITSAFWEFVLSIPLYSMWLPPIDITGDAMILLTAFFFGIGGYRLQTEVLKYINAFRK